MEVLITGAAGFIGRSLAARLRNGAVLRDAQGRELRPDRLVLCDIVAGVPLSVPAEASSGPHPGAPAVAWRTGSLADRDFAASLIGPDTACVFHLAGIVSGAAEADFDAGIGANLDGTRYLLDALKRRADTGIVRLVHASSIAVYGAPVPTRIDDHTQPWPTLSYGAHKLAGELLLGDMSRRGLVDGRSLRLSGVVVRPVQPNGALSSFNSDLIREPLAGRPVVSPVSPGATIWLQSIARTVDNLLHAMALDAAAFGIDRTVLLPALACRIDEIVDAIGEVAGTDATRLVSYQPDERIEPMFGRWPKPFIARRGLALGFGADRDVLSLIKGFAASQGAGVPSTAEGLSGRP
jgi:nucleoside-diphosphate-sugar epimerase